MAERRRLLDLVDRAYRANAWHGPALMETLAGVTPELAAKRALKGAHTIWELVEHIATWNDVVALRLAGEAPQVSAERNFPKVQRPSPAAWRKSLLRLAASQRRFRARVATFPERRLGLLRPGAKTTWYVLIHGQIQHQLYHAGQVAMLRRGLGKPIAQ